MYTGYNDLSPIRPFLDSRGIEVLDESEGFIRCVGRHTTPDRVKDCKVFMNASGIPRVYCFHTSCREEVAHLNRDLTSWLRGQDRQRGGMWEGRYTSSRKRSNIQKTDNLQKDAEEALGQILQEHDWPYTAICADSPVKVAPDLPQHAYLLSLFNMKDIVWIGRDVHDSGTERHRYRFRPAEEWLMEKKCPGHFICPSAFHPRVFSRSNAIVCIPRYLVVESDTLRANQIGAIFRWLQKDAGLSLHAVVDTAGKSLHGWFEYPPTEMLKELKVILPAMGCDPALFKPSQPCRLPGAARNGRYQTLIYVSHK